MSEERQEEIGEQEFLISTHEHLLHLAFDFGEREGKVTPIASGARYYGIATDPSGEVWIAKNTRNSEDISEIVGLHSDDEIDFEIPLKDVHQITYANGGLYICNTYYNSVVFKDLRTGAEHVHTIGGEFEHDYAHPNSLWIESPYVYVLLHNKRFRRSELARLRHDRTEGFDEGYRSEVRLKLPNQACHNIRFDRAILTYLASEANAVMQLNHLTGEVLRAFPNPGGYLKGMAKISPEKILIGMNPNVPAAQRYESEAKVGVVDIFDRGSEFGVPLTLPDGGPVGNINEIRRIRSGERGGGA